jgi:hypothetical protein
MVDATESALLNQVFVGQERVTRDEIYRRAAAGELPAAVLSHIDSLPEGEYAQEEVEEALNAIPQPGEDEELRPLGEPTDTTGDFATEHDDTTTGPDLDSGPEGVREEESPRGLGGADITR